MQTSSNTMPGKNNRAANTILPGALCYTRNLTLAGQVAEADPAKVKIADECTGTAAKGAPIHATALELRLNAGFMFFGCG